MDKDKITNDLTA